MNRKKVFAIFMTFVLNSVFVFYVQASAGFHKVDSLSPNDLSSLDNALHGQLSSTSPSTGEIVAFIMVILIFIILVTIASMISKKKKRK